MAPSRRATRSLLLPIILAVASVVSVRAQGLRLNMLQVIHSHNSYHTCPIPNMIDLFNSKTGELVRDRLGSSAFNPLQWYYDKPPVEQQIRELGVRSFEFDVVYDDVGGRYRYRAGPKLARKFADTDDSQKDGGPDFDSPGWKVLHVPDFDFQTSCNTFGQCLTPLAAFTNEVSKHTPIFITLEFKTWNPDELISGFAKTIVNGLLSIPDDPPTRLTSTPTPDGAHLQQLEQEILMFFNRSAIYTPDDFRGNYSTMQERITAIGWPRLRDLRGRIIFRTTGDTTYLSLQDQLWPGGRGSLLFKEGFVTGPDPPDADTVFVTTDLSLLQLRNPPAVAALGQNAPIEALQTPDVADAFRDAIREIVAGGKVMLRATADMPVAQAMANFRGFANAAIAGGAHFVHTDSPGGFTTNCGGVNSEYTVRLVQVLRDSWDGVGVSAANTTAWNGTATENVLAAVCNPVTSFSSCGTWPTQGLLQPPRWCSCYSRI